MAVWFLSRLHSQKCLDHAENLSSALVKLSVQDANVQKRAWPALISANANTANDSFVMYITTVSSFHQLKWNSYTVSLYCTTEKLYDKSVSCIATHSYNIYLLLWWNRDRTIWFNTQLIGLSGLCCKQTHKMCSLVTTHIYVIYDNEHNLEDHREKIFTEILPFTI